MTAEEIATQIRASGQIVERREIPERTIEQEAEKIKQFALQVAMEAVGEEVSHWNTQKMKKQAAYHGHYILENIKRTIAR